MRLASRSWSARLSPRRLPHRDSVVGARPRWFAKAQAQTEFEGPDDNSVARLLPRPAVGGFNRGTFICRASSQRAFRDTYEILGNLGSGATGTVSAARHRERGDPVAVKSVSMANISDCKALAQEVEFLKIADHPNIVRLYEVFHEDDNIYLVMEQCTGGELWKRIVSAHEVGLGFSEAELREAMRQMFVAVAFCHSHSIVHRDLKPQNFIYASSDPNAALKLVDFGVSGVVEAMDPGRRFLTRTVGSDGYIAPEVLLSRPYGPRADVFSLGAVMHAIVVGLPPAWRGGSYNFPGKMRWRMLSPNAQNLLSVILDSDPEKRLDAAEALRHPWFQAEDGRKDVSLLDATLLNRLQRFGQKSKLQRCMMGNLVALATLQGPEVEALQRVFLSVDTEASGDVSVKELDAALRLLAEEGGLPLGLNAEEVLQGVDTSGQGSISYSEWIAATASNALFNSPGLARHAFDSLDADLDGQITAAELCQALPGVFSLDELEEEIGRFDVDGDRVISFEEFCQILVHGS